MLLDIVNLDHMSLPVVFSGECFATSSGIVAAGDGAMELLLLLVSVINMSLKVSLGAEALSTAWVWALVVFAVVSLVMSKTRELVPILSNKNPPKQQSIS